MSELTSYEDTHAAVETGHHAEKSFFDPNAKMLGLTWLTFLLLLVILYKFAFKPILSALEQREQDIKKSVDDADKIKNELAELETKTNAIINRADDEAKSIVAESRKAAGEAARTIEHKAREEAQIVLENAKRKIKEELDKAKAKIRKDSAEAAVMLAGKLIEKNLDDASNKKLIDKLIEEM